MPENTPKLPTFTDRLAGALTKLTSEGITDHTQIASILIASDIVGDPVEHQSDLRNIAARQDRETEAWTDEYTTVPDGNGNAFVSTTHEPEWREGAATMHRRVTAWRPLTRSAEAQR